MVFIQPFGPSFSQAIVKLMEQPGIQLSACASTLEAVSLSRRAGSCLMVCAVDREESLTKFLNMHKMLFQSLREGSIRLLVTSNASDEMSRKKLMSQVATEVLPEPVTEKSLIFKINRLVQLLPDPARLAGKSGSPAAAAKSGKATGSSSGLGRAAAPKENAGALLRMVASLRLASDCWVSVPGETKFIGGRWIIKLKGPSVNSGNWVAIESNIPGHQAWQWMPSADSPQAKEKGAWVFQGEKPEMRGGYWTFMGKRPDLSFYYEGASCGSKLAPDTTKGNSFGLLMAADSQTAHKALSQAGKASSESENPASPENGAEAGGSFTPRFDMVDPLEIESDCWLLQRRVPRRAADKWIVTLLGPSPTVGRWVSIDDGKNEGPGEEGQDSWWCWVPFDPDNDPFILEEGGWVFRGQLPKYVDGGWVFAARRPELAYYYDGDSYGAKLILGTDGALKVARDSDAAERLAPTLRATEDSIVTVPKQESAATQKNNESAPEGPLSFRFAPNYFSPAGGEWESAGFGSQSRRWYLYLPYEVLNDANSQDVRRWGVYWLYFGPTAPKLDKDAWVFEARKPQPHKIFADLPKEIQKFILEYFPGDGAKGKAGAGMRRIPCKVFGQPGGEWECVSTGSQGRRWYAYVSVEVLEGRAGDIRKQNKYWVYFGPTPPKKDQGTHGPDFVFEERDPRSFVNFGDLPKPAQEFFKQYFDQKGAEAEGESATATDPLAEFEALLDDQTESSDAEGEDGAAEEVAFSDTDADAEASAEEKFNPLLKMREDTELVFPAEAEVEASDEGAMVAGLIDPFLEKGDNGSDIIQRLEGELQVTRYPVEMIGTPTGSWGVVDASDPENRLHVYVAMEIENHLVEEVESLGTYWTYRGKELPHVVNEGGKKYWSFVRNQPEGVLSFEELDEASKKFLRKALTAPKPETAANAAFQPKLLGLKGADAIQEILAPGATLSPLAMAFLMSELVRNKGLDRKLVGRRFCEYLSAALKVRVELWVHSISDTWFCGGASQDGEGRHGGLLKAGSGLQFGLSPEGVFVAPIFADSSLGNRKVIGALLLECADPEQMTKEYAGFAARVARGLLLTLSGAEQKSGIAA